MNERYEMYDGDPMKVTPDKNNSSGGKVAAAAIGGVVAGLGIGAAGAYAASTSHSDVPEVDPGTEDTTGVQDGVPNESPVTNVGGIPVAHVNATSFADAFAQARAQVGPGGAFEYNGKIYGTYYETEWNNMTAAEKAAYQAQVTEAYSNTHTSHHPAPNYVTVNNITINHPPHQEPPHQDPDPGQDPFEKFPTIPGEEPGGEHPGLPVPPTIPLPPGEEPGDPFPLPPAEPLPPEPGDPGYPGDPYDPYAILTPGDPGDPGDPGEPQWINPNEPYDPGEPILPVDPNNPDGPYYFPNHPELDVADNDLDMQGETIVYVDPEDSEIRILGVDDSYGYDGDVSMVGLSIGDDQGLIVDIDTGDTYDYGNYGDYHAGLDYTSDDGFDDGSFDDPAMFDHDII